MTQDFLGQAKRTTKAGVEQIEDLCLERTEAAREVAFLLSEEPDACIRCS